MTPLSLVGTASYLPATVVGNDFFAASDDGGGRSPMFKGARRRHHVSAGETATSMVVEATRKLAARTGVDPKRDVELVLTNVSLPDLPFTGCGASVSRELGCAPRFILDMHNSGCVSFVFMMEIARSLMASTGARTALVCNAQTTGGRIFAHPENRKHPQSAVPGDGCGVGFLVANDESPVRAIVTRSCPDFADDMQVSSEDGEAWWAPRRTPTRIDFTESRIAAIVARGNQLVPEVVREACQRATLPVDDIDVLVTNQPNPIFLRNWREALLLPPEAHVHTYEDHGNLFGAAIPISLAQAEDDGRLKPRDHLVLGGFSHAGDYAGAAVVHWKPRG